jgi:hypothetical protein
MRLQQPLPRSPLPAVVALVLSIVGIAVLLLGAITAFLGGWYARRSRRRGARRTTTADLLPIALGVALIGMAAFVISAFSV